MAAQTIMGTVLLFFYKNPFYYFQVFQL